MEMYKLVFYGLGSFFIGAIPCSYIITKLFSGADIRKVGSGNPGATNVVRALGWKYGILTLVLDIAKGFFPVFFAGKSDNPVLVPVVAIAVVLGHDYTPFLGFRGGKGVASSLGVFLFLAPIPILLVSVIFSTLYIIFRFVSVGSLMAAISYPAMAYLVGDTQYLWLAMVLAGLIIFKHRSNIKRLWHGKEKKAI